MDLQIQESEWNLRQTINTNPLRYIMDNFWKLRTKLKKKNLESEGETSYL